MAEHTNPSFPRLGFLPLSDRPCSGFLISLDILALHDVRYIRRAKLTLSPNGLLKADLILVPLVPPTVLSDSGEEVEEV